MLRKFRNHLRFEPLEPRRLLDGSLPIISEFMAVNARALEYPANSDQYPDWIEIHNPTDTSIALDGWYLTDEEGDRTKWRFPDIPAVPPEVLLEPGDYLMVYASGENNLDPANLHTNFQLNGDGEYLALVKPDGTTVAHEFYPEFPEQREDISFGVSQDVSTFVPERAEASYLVPTLSDSGDNWTEPGYDDSGWTSSRGTGLSGLMITEIDNTGTAWLEIENVWDGEIDTAGWFVAINDGLSGNINAANPTVWSLPAAIPAGQVLYKTDNPADNYWGRDIRWDSSRGWVMIVNDRGEVADFLPWGYSEAQIAGLNVSVGGFSNIALGSQWSGASPAGMSNGWQTGSPGDDVGGPGQAGSHTYSAGTGTYTIHGGGADIWYDSDQFYYVHQSLNGDTEVIAKVSSVENTDPWAKAGVMIRESLNANSAHATVVMTPDSGVSFQYRTATGGDSGHNTIAGYSAPRWVRLVRTGNEFKAYHSADGSNWEYIASQTIPMASSVNVGLAVTSHNDSTLCTAQIQNVTVGMPAPPEMLERIGDADNNTAADFTVPQSQSKGTQNADLTLPFPGSEGEPVRTGIGYNISPGGFEVTMVKASVVVGSLSAAEAVISDPNQQAWVQREVVDVINYYNTGGEGRYPNNLPFPGTTIGNDVEDFVIEATSAVIIPSAGQWTFGVNSDDGFGLELTNGVDTFTSSWPDPRGSADTLRTFDFNTPGVYGLRLVMYERGGGSEVELFAAQGSHAVFNASDFDLVGDYLNGGLMVSGFGDAIQTDVLDEMRGVNPSLWTRIEFDVEDPSTLDSLLLRMKYNDGFVAYLNGHEIASSNAPGSPQWNSTATDTQSNEESLVFEDINVTGSIGYLQETGNVLAVHGLNYDASDDSFLVLPVLIGSHTGSVHRYFSEPTPNGPNALGFIDFVGDTRFSVDRGFYTNSFPLEIVTDTPGATIRYTLDGSEPTETNGYAYGGPLTISGTTILRAAAFKTDYFPANVDTQTYIFLDDVVLQSPTGQPPTGWPSGSVNGQRFEYGMDSAIVNSGTWGPQLTEALTSIPTMSLVTDLASLVDPGSGIYVNAGAHGYAWERPASLELIYPEGASGAGFPDGADDGFQVETGVRIRGGYSRSGNNPKHAFRLFFRREYGDPKLNYPLFGLEGADSFDKIDLRTAQNYSWSYANDGSNTMNRDVTARDAQGQMGQAYTRSRYYHLYLNGQYWGIYQTQERAEAAYGETYFGGDKDTEWDTVKATGNSGGYTTEATDGNMDAWQDLWDLSNQVAAAGTNAQRTALYHQMMGENSDGSQNLSYPVLLDVENLVDYMLMVFFDGDRDAPISNFLGNDRTNNWFGIRNRNGEEGFRFFVHDAEHTLSKGLPDRTGPFPAGDQFQYANPQWIHQQLMNHEDYQILVADRAYKYMYNGGLLTAEVAIERFQARADQIDMAIIAESARWGSSSLTKNTWLNALNNEINNFFPARAPTVFSQVTTGVFPPTFNQHGGQIDPGFEVTMSAPSGTIYYTTDGSDPRLEGGGISPTAEIYQGSTTTVSLIDIAAADPWKYNQSGTNLGTSWRQSGYNDNGWSSGDALLYYESSGLPAAKRTQLTLGETTYYFRKHFTLGEDPADVQLQLRSVIDDAMVVYLNGQEVFRLGFNPGTTVNYNTFADRTVSNAVYEGPFSIPTDDLIQGDNVIAVEVHQTSAGSSDVVFGIELDALISTTINPVELTGSAPVKARAKSGSTWSGLCDAQFFVDQPASADNVLITELNYHPYDPTAAELAMQPPADPDWTAEDFEFIEIGNVSGQPVSLAGVSFSDGITFDFDAVTVAAVGSGESVVVARNVAAFEARYGAGINVVGGYTSKLSNNGETLELSDFFGNRIVRFEYNGPGDWPGRAAGKGATLELVDPGATPATEPARTDYLSDGDSWRSSSEWGGTPGWEGTGPIGDVVVNEVLTHTDPPDLDTIELHNTTGQPIHVGGWYLSDRWGWASSPDNGNYKKFEIPGGTMIPAGGYIVFDENDFNLSGGVDPLDFALNGAQGDDVWLMEADTGGNLTRFVDHVEFDAAANGESWGRWPNATGQMYPMTRPTLDPEEGANSGPRVGPVVFSEVMYNPQPSTEDQTLEFIEIFNSSLQPVDLTEWRIRDGIEYNFPTGMTLESGAVLVIVPFDLTDTLKWTAFCNKYSLDVGNTEGFLGGYDQQLGDGGETVRLLRPDYAPPGEFIPRLTEDEVRYDDDPPWPISADGGGDSLHRVASDAWGKVLAGWEARTPSPGTTTLELIADQVVGRYVFYNGSFFDTPTPQNPGFDDDTAIATDKTALLPGETAAFANYTSYTSGINGIMIDIEGMPPLVSLTAIDFEFRVGNSSTPGSWAVAEDPTTIAVRAGEGLAGSDRVTLIWPNNAIVKQWLQVTVLDTANTGLTRPDVFYFGNAIGEMGNSPTDAKVNAIDMLGARDNQRNFFNPAEIDFSYDFNRDARVNSTDMLIARNNQTHFLNALKLIAVPATGGKAAASLLRQHDAALEEVLVQSAGQRAAPSVRVSWLYEFEQPKTVQGEDTTETVDQLLATYEP